MRRVVIVCGGLLGFVVTTAAVAAIFAELSHPTLWQLLAMQGNNQGKTTATVTSIDVGDHNTCRYRYVVERKSLTGSHPCDASTPGNRIQVFYRKDNPSVSTVGGPLTQAISVFIFPVLLGIVISVLVMVALTLFLA